MAPSAIKLLQQKRWTLGATSSKETEHVTSRRTAPIAALLTACCLVGCSDAPQAESQPPPEAPETVGVQRAPDSTAAVQIQATQVDTPSTESRIADRVLARILADPAAGPVGSGDLRWPGIEVQLPRAIPDTVRALIPECQGEARVSTEGVGPVYVGERLDLLFERCPRLWPYYHWEEGAPFPAVAVRVSGAVLRVEVSDTTRDAEVRRILTNDPPAVTSAGLGPGRTVLELITAYGSLHFGSAECAVYAWSDALPGVSWLLELPSGWDCIQAEATNDEGGPTPPDDTRVGLVIVFNTPGSGA